MSVAEVAWRAASAVRDARDRLAWSAGIVPPAPESVAKAAEERTPPAVRLADLAVGEWAVAPEGSREAVLRDTVVARARRILEARLDIFDLEAFPVGWPPDWNREYKAGRSTPRAFAPAIDYRDFRLVGDAKFAWEPSRHLHLPVLGRAYRATGDVRFAAGAVALLESWLDQCPYLSGIQWHSPLEIAIRAVNWSLTLDLVWESGELSGARGARILHALWLHLHEIRRRYSRASSANNHLVGEAAGVFVGTTLFPCLDPDGTWNAQSRAILSREIGAQTHEDGGTREQAFGYHIFVAEFFTLAAIVARRAARALPRAYEERLERMFDFAAALSEGGPAPMFGDADDGHVFDLGGGHEQTLSLFALGAAFFRRGDLKRLSQGRAEGVRWLMGETAYDGYRAIAAPPDSTLASRALPESGYYLLQSGRQGAAGAVSLVFDCGELGFSSLAAHGHADALSLCLRVGGEDVLVDPGTYDYFTYPALRSYFRSTRAHNTLEVDGVDQSIMLGPFLWGQRARARCLEWDPEGPVVRVRGEHDGYRRLPSPVWHRRRVSLATAEGVVVVEDEVSGGGRHVVAMRWHLAEACRVLSLDGRRCRVAFPGGYLEIDVDERLALHSLSASEDPPGGWVSRGYHRRKPSVTLVARAEVDADVILTTRMRILGAEGRP
jgi:Heparinase II/III-like protein/Heparinase II/III N-terminus